MPIPAGVVLEAPRPSPAAAEDTTSTGAPLGWWRGGNGDELLLSDCSSGIDWLPGRGGTDMPPYDFTEEQVIGGDGALVVDVRAVPRTVTIPVLLHLDTFGEWRALHQRFLRSLNPANGPGRLTIAQPDGERRHLDCYYQAGAEGADVQDPRGLWYRVYPMQWRGHQPFWYADRDVELPPWRPAVSGGGFLAPPFLPLKLGSSTVIGDTTATILGDIAPHPVWTVSGPGGPLLLRNVTTGQDLALDYVLDGPPAPGEPAEQVIIDTRPGRRSVRNTAGDNLWPLLGWPPQLWALQPGVNQLQLAMSDATADSMVELSYRPRYLSA